MHGNDARYLFLHTAPYASQYAAIGGGVAAAVVAVCIIIIILVYRCKCKPKQDPNNGSGLEGMAGEEAPPPGYETTIVASPEASGSDTLRMNMENDQQGEIENEYLTPRMKRETMEAEYVDMKTIDNQVVMVTEDIYEKMADDAAGKHAVTSKEAEYSVVI
ncbi:uncharacterized protein LOC115925342 [Strongylocentrotus purpuratus]|uniref:Uncharacterized protein n=1 Tax=Strongylocentrotus purpuratus TaxID=7668 RepID=A0A7M7P428_STRPU|nr:uncharacterized protein LOC115925342 [Strongylocentrotus purpuratus]